MVIPSRNAISSADMSEEKNGVGLKKEEARHTKFYQHTIFHFQRHNPKWKEKKTTLRVETRLQGPAWLEREVKKANEQEDQLNWREKGEKRGCRASWKDGKNQGSAGNGRTKAGRGGGKEEAYSITWEKKGRQRRRNAGEACNKRGNIKVQRTRAETQVSGVNHPAQ